MIEADAKVLVDAGEWHGLVKRREALKSLSVEQLQWRLSTGAWVEVFPRVYRVLGAPVTWRQNLVALHEWAKKGVVFSHRTAAALHGFESFKEGPLEVTSTKRLRSPPGIVVYRAEYLAHNDLTEIDDLPVTNVARTLFDLAARTDSNTLRTTFDQALREKKTTLEQLERLVKRSGNRPGVIDARELIADLSGAGSPTESVLEDRCLALIEAAGLPRPTVQWSTIAGRKRRRLDLFFEKYGVVVEADGYASHSGVQAFEADRERNNALTAANLKLLHWTWSAIESRPDELIAELYVVMNLRS
jgi:predicted transcriptional regulator of viral defense system